MSRGRRIVLAALLVGGVVVAVGAAAVGYAALADPVEYASFVAAPTGGRDTGVPNEGRMQYQVPYADGGEVAWAIRVRNPLLVPVTITGVHPSLSELAPLVASEELRRPGTDPISLAPEDLRPFEPVELAPGEVATIVVREQLAACAEAHEAWSPGSGLVRSTLPLDVSVLGVPRTAEVDLRFAIIYSAPPGDCATP